MICGFVVRATVENGDSCDDAEVGEGMGFGLICTIQNLKTRKKDAN